MAETPVCQDLSEVLLYAVGDVLPYREEPGSIFHHVAGALSRADIAFCQLEANLSERGTRLPQARHTVRAHPKTARALREAGFNVVSFAGNHCMDWGREAFFDTIGALEEAGISVLGVGKNLEEARKPVIIEAKGNRIAFLGYNTILPMGYWAENDRPGCTPMRAWTYYEQIEHDQPGTPCRIHTFPNRNDLQALVNDVEKAKSRADVVIMSIHWGLHFVPAALADYQREVAHAAIDAGVDLILGHHAHILKPVEVYKRKVIFYSLCNFAIDLPAPPGLSESKGFQEIRTLNPDWHLDPECLYNFPTDSQKSVLVKCLISGRALKRVSFVPVYISKKEAQPQILQQTDPRFSEVIRYLEEITRDQGLATRYVLRGAEVAVE